ncbi:MAG: hypothetical protein ACSLE0_17220, partial [Chitinophagaceae bacterium]
MASYLLLRNNKESGPFTMDELLSSGIKPYDLVWVQGKSAAWRYPSEVEELKPYAPVIEEQPYDRFYKKNKEEQKPETPVSNEPVSPAPVCNKNKVQYTPKKSVFVTLPDQKRETITRKPEPIFEASPITPVISIAEKNTDPEIKYSKPLDEIKEMYVKTLQNRKDKNAKREILTSILKKAAVVAGILILGVLAGFIIKSKPGNDKKESAEKTLPSLPVGDNNQPEEIAEAIPEKEEILLETVPVSTDEQNNGQDISRKPDKSQPMDGEHTNVKIRKETMLIVPKRSEEFEVRQVKTDEEFSPSGTERERKIRTADKNEKPITKTDKNGLRDLVSVASNDYKRVAFGGIRNLFITVTNNSKYEIENVIVELQYLKPSEELLRTENIKF